MARHAARGLWARSRRRWWIAVGLTVVAATVVLALLLTGGNPPRVPHRAQDARRGTSTTTSAAPTTTTTTTTTLPAGFVAGHVTAVGDSVMLDYQTALETDIPGIDVEAAVSRQWSAGETLVQQDRAANQLGAQVIVALGTNGPITAADFDAMMTALAGATRVVFVNVHVDRPWQDPNNAILAAGEQRYATVRIADWNSLATMNPGWFGSDGTHLAINGPGASALASLITTTLSQP